MSQSDSQLFDGAVFVQQTLYHALASDTSRLTQQTTPAAGTFRCPETVHMNSFQHDYSVMMTLVI